MTLTTLRNLSEKPCLTLFPALTFKPRLRDCNLCVLYNRFERSLSDIRAGHALKNRWINLLED